jgi:hypothetical protein
VFRRDEKRKVREAGAGLYKVTDYTKLEQEIDAQADVIWDMASKSWTLAELGFVEKKSSA